MDLTELKKLTQEEIDKISKPRTREEIEAATREMSESGMTPTQESGEFDARLEKAGIGKRFRGCNFYNLNHWKVPDDCRDMYESAKRYAEHFQEHEKSGIGLLLIGPVGTMKTSIAVAVAQEVMKQGRSSMFIPMAELFDRLMTFSKQRDNNDFLNYQERLRTTSLLVLDDLGTEYPNDWIRNKIDAIISYRYNEMKPIVITTNLTTGEMLTQYQMRMCDRLKASSITLVSAAKASHREEGKEI